LLPGAAAFCAALLVALLGLRATAETPPVPTGQVELQLLGVNDFHANLEPPQPGLGGAAWLDAHLDRAARSHPGRTIRVHAGDMVGASPLVSSHFHDEPGVEAMNAMDFDVGTLGNHEFDEGGEELMRLLRGGRRGGAAALKRGVDGRLRNTSDPGYRGARFPYVAANAVDAGSGRRLLPPFEIVERDGVQVGFIGVTTDTSGRYLLPGIASRYRFLDVSESVNRWVPELRRRGVEAIVVLAHSGGRDGAGEILDEARQMDDAVDVLVTGHTHTLLNERVDGKLVVQAFAFGTAFERIAITVDRSSGEVVRKAAEVVRTRHELPPDRHTRALVSGYAARVAPLANRVVGIAARDYSRERGDLGRLAADAQRALAGAELAFVNPGNMREDLAAGPLSYAEIFAVHSYEHPVLSMRMRGRHVLELLSQQRAAGLYTRLYTSGMRSPEAIEPGRVYSVAANALIATGDRFPALRDRAWGKRVVGSDLEALVAWVERGGAAR
jgi:5'-nucleotidase